MNFYLLQRLLVIIVPSLAFKSDRHLSGWEIQGQRNKASLLCFLSSSGTLLSNFRGFFGVKLPITSSQPSPSRTSPYRAAEDSKVTTGEVCLPMLK